ncbi:MAG: hypothetical protein ACKPGB_30635 [Dolichospermum sp.]
MSVTNTFEIRVVRHQIQSCLRAIKNGLKSFVDRLIILEDKLEKLLQKLQSATIKKEQTLSVEEANPLPVSGQLTRDNINEVLLSAGLYGRFKCKKIFIDYDSVNAESNVILDHNENPVFDCGWKEWKSRIQEFLKLVETGEISD